MCQVCGLSVPDHPIYGPNCIWHSKWRVERELKVDQKIKRNKNYGTVQEEKYNIFNKTKVITNKKKGKEALELESDSANVVKQLTCHEHDFSSIGHLVRLLFEFQYCKITRV